MDVICAWCGGKVGEAPGEGVSHGICPECLKKHFAEEASAVLDSERQQTNPGERRRSMGEEVPRREITRMALEMVTALRAVAAGIARCPQLERWTEDELERAADNIMDDLRLDNPEGIASLRDLYQKTGGNPIKEVRYE